MDNKDYKNRLIDKKIEKYLKAFGAICIEGPKWCGKTWTSLKFSNSVFMLANPEGNFNNKKIAELNPSLALDGHFPHLIDEWQEVPSIWDAVRYNVDINQVKGQYILTGSSTVNVFSYIHSGAGRIAKIKMRPMSLYEQGFSSGLISLKDIANNKINDCLTGEVNLDNLIDYIIRGGWPANIDLDIDIAKLLPLEYINSILNIDIYKLDNKRRDKHKIELLLRSLARNESTTVSNKVLKNDIKEIDNEDVNIDSISEYLQVMERLFLLENTKPYSPNIRSSIRVKQSEKRHFVDPSLAVAILKLNKEKLLSNLDYLGFLFEALVERDLLIYSEANDLNMYHYQDYNNDEIDAIIENEDGSWCGIEIKLGAHQIDQAAQNLLKINNKIKEKNGKPAKSLCVICGLTNAAYRRKDGVMVVPLTSLKD